MQGAAWAHNGFSTVWHRFKKALKEEGLIAPGVTLGGLRHTVATTLREAGLDERRIAPVIPPESNRRFPAGFDKDMYKWRHLIENYFGRFKENRGIAMRSYETDQSFKAFISLAASIIQLRSPPTGPS